MGRLGGFHYREIVRRLRLLGFVLERQGKGSHEQWRHPISHRKVLVARHVKAMPEGTLRSILREAGIDVEDFLKA